MKRKLIRIITSAVLLAGVMLMEKNSELPLWQLLIAYLIPYIICSYDVIAEAWEGLTDGEVFNEDMLMCIATMGALCVGFLPGGENEMAEAVFVMLFFQLGELFEDYAEGKSRRSIKHLMSLRPDTATVERDGNTVEVKPETVKIGETIIVKVGERIPLDGTIIDGTSALDTAALTGESLPRDVTVGDNALSGCVNLSAVLRLRVEKVFGESTASKIISLVENAGANKSKRETFIARFAKIYTPVVVGMAVLLAVVPPLFSEAFTDSFTTWLMRALTFLVVSCPCALVISIPLSYFGGIGGASRRGILVKGSTFMDALAKASTIVFDKTGTLTRGQFEVEAVHPDRITPNELLHIAAHVERYSTHPIAQTLRDAYPSENDSCRVENAEEVAGQGVRAEVNGKVVSVGNSRLMDGVGAKWHPCHRIGTTIHVAIDGEYAGHIVVADTVKADSKEAITALKRAGIKRTVMLTGDRKDVGKDVAGSLGLDEYHAELMPDDKVRWLEKLLKEKPKGRTLAFVGDGINDAPSLARADVGIAMGGLGSDAAIEAADIVIMDDKPSKIATAIALSRRTIRIATENAIFAIGIKVAVLILAAFGMATMWMAVFADVGVTVIAVLNAMRTLSTKKVK